MTGRLQAMKDSVKPDRTFGPAKSHRVDRYILGLTRPSSNNGR